MKRNQGIVPSYWVDCGKIRENHNEVNTFFSQFLFNFEVQTCSLNFKLRWPFNEVIFLDRDGLLFRQQKILKRLATKMYRWLQRLHVPTDYQMLKNGVKKFPIFVLDKNNCCVCFNLWKTSVIIIQFPLIELNIKKR